MININMMENNHIQHDFVRFKRWARKNYAIFSSLKREIQIGVLSKGIADASWQKMDASDSSYFSHDMNANPDCLLNEEDEPTHCEEMLNWRLSGNANFVILEAEPCEYNTNRNIITRSVMDALHLLPFFFDKT